ncbi:MAG: hypothetical protein WC775_03145 [Patescibacteria group bacterium]
MMNDIKKYPVDYLVLLVYALVSVALLSVRHDPQQRLIVGTLFALYYFIWAVLHHVRIKRITFSVVLEYLLITILGFVTLQVIFFPLL